jgi:predicted secreted protein
MANHLGKEGILKLSTTTVAEFRGYSLSESAANTEDTVIGDDWTTHRTTLKSWSVNFDLFWDETDTGQLAMTLGSLVTVNLYPEGIGSGATYKSGAALIESLDLTGRHDSVVEYAVGVKGTGALSTITV